MPNPVATPPLQNNYLPSILSEYSPKLLAASQTFDTTTTLTAITGFSWPVVANGKYMLEAVLRITATTSGGIALGHILTTATLTSIGSVAELSTATNNGTAVSVQGTTVTSATKLVNTKTAAYTYVRLNMNFVVNAAGTFALGACQETAAGTTDVTIILLNSHAVLRRVA